MATWKKVIVSGSQAELAGVTGSFTGSFSGNGAGLTGVTATPTFPTTAITNLASTDKFFVNDDAGDAASGNKKITYDNLLTDLASRISVTGLTSSFNGNLTGTASWASSASHALTSYTFATSIGNGSATNIGVTHNMGTRDVIVQLYDTTTYETIVCDIVRTDINFVTCSFKVAPGTNQYRVVIKS